MPDKEKMKRVNKRNPCPVCGKPDWCLVAEDGSAAICQRIKEGSIKNCSDAGYLHILKDRYRQNTGKNRLLRVAPKGRSQTKDFGQLARQYQKRLNKQLFDTLSTLLGVSVQGLKRLNTGWDGRAFTFGMSNDFGKIIGIRRRFPNGYKVSVKGSRTGLFIPDDLLHEGLLLICEGPTDTVAALDLGFDAIGRPNCNCKIEMTASAVKDYKEIVIVADNDTAGKAGAERLADYLTVRCPKVKVIYPPEGIKDLRQWLRAGLTGEALQQIIGETEELQIKISFKDSLI